MGKKNKKGGGGLPGWFATYSDMMTLLFAFFVLLFSLSTLDPVKLAEFAEGDKKGESKDLGEIKKEFEKMIEELGMDSTATVTQDPRGIALEIDGDICFESSQVELQPKLKEVLDRAINDVLTEKGETDLSPTTEAKWQTSKPAQPWLRNQHIFLPSKVAQEALPGTHSLQGKVRDSRLK